MARKKQIAKLHSMFEIAKKLKEKKASSGQPDHEVNSATTANNNDKPGATTAPSANLEPSPNTVGILQTVSVYINIERGNKKSAAASKHGNACTQRWVIKKINAQFSEEEIKSMLQKENVTLRILTENAL